MGKVTIAVTDDGFNMNSSPPDAAKAMELFVKAIKQLFLGITT